VNRLSDEDVERIASKTVSKFVGSFFGIVLFLVFAFWLLPIIIFGSFTGIANATAGLPAVVGTALTASVIAVPLVLLVLLWSRTRTR
jgi:hypothetical protein